MCWMLIILISLWKQADSIRILDLRIPGHAAEGGPALLGCQFDLEGDDLYSVKWYKDGREFFRYVPSNIEPNTYFSMPGVFVDVSRSSSTVVALEHLSKESGGRYRCEVSGEAPYFVTASGEKDISIHLIPNKGPRVTGLQNEYRIGDVVSANCSSSRSRPKAQLKWLVNDRQIPEKYLRGPWERASRERTDARETTLGLNFVLSPSHFREGVMTLKCQAAIAPLYQDEVVHHILRVEAAEPIDSEESINRILQEYDTVDFRDDIDFSLPSDSQREIDSKGNSARSNLSVWGLLPSMFLLHIYTLIN